MLLPEIRAVFFCLGTIILGGDMKYIYTEIKAKNNDIIRGVLNTPDTFDKNKKYKSLIFYHGLMDDRNGINYMSIQQAKYLTAAGYLVFRFDFRGCGESEGSFFDLTFTRQIEDSFIIYDWVKENNFVDSENIYIRAHSMGGAVAIKTAAKKNPKGLILYAPGSNYSIQNSNLIRTLDEKIKSQATAEKDLGGLKISAKIAEDSKNYDFLEIAKAYEGKVLIVRGDKDPVIDRKSIENLAKSFKNANYQEIKDLGHNFTNYEKRLEIFELTNRFMEEE